MSSISLSYPNISPSGFRASGKPSVATIKVEPGGKCAVGARLEFLRLGRQARHDPQENQRYGPLEQAPSSLKIRRHQE